MPANVAAQCHARAAGGSLNLTKKGRLVSSPSPSPGRGRSRQSSFRPGLSLSPRNAYEQENLPTIEENAETPVWLSRSHEDRQRSRHPPPSAAGGSQAPVAQRSGGSLPASHPGLGGSPAWRRSFSCASPRPSASSPRGISRECAAKVRVIPADSWSYRRSGMRLRADSSSA